MKKIVFVGQTPPPYGGQAIMIQEILRGDYPGIKLIHVRLSFSREMNEIGSISLGKVFHLIRVVAAIWYYRFTENAKILYYPPAGPDRVPIIRDVLILLSVRWIFSRTIFHFHAGGLSEVRIKSPFFRFLFKKAYERASCAIILSDLNPPEGTNLRALKQVIVPYGIEDKAKDRISRDPTHSPGILFVGVIRESKGIVVLLEACAKLAASGRTFSLEIMGSFESKEFESMILKKIKELKIDSSVVFLGVLSGELKWASFRKADIFCFPTFFESETFGVVLLEAMQFSLPIVATRWRGIPSIVEEGENGFLVKPNDADELFDRLVRLVDDDAARSRMGVCGRDIFLSKYTLPKFHSEMARIFQSC